MGENAFLSDQTGNKIATWQTQERNSIDVTKLREELPDIAEQYSKTTKSRIFKVQ